MTTSATSPFLSAERPTSSSGSARKGNSRSQVPSTPSSIKSVPGSPRGSVRSSRLPGQFPFAILNDTIEEISRTPEWIVFTTKDLTDPKPSYVDIRRKLVDEFPFLLEAEFAATKRSEARSRPRLFSSPSAPTVLATSASHGSLNTQSKGTLQLNFTAGEERQVMRVRLVTETRSLHWRPFSAASAEQKDEEVRDLLPIASLPSAWSLPIDTRSTAQRALAKGPAGTAKRTFELADMRTLAACSDCRGSSTSKCSECEGIEEAICFWCDGTGRRRGQADAKKCHNCNGHGRTFCSACSNSGTKKCDTCEGKGKANMGLFVDIRMKIKDMPVVSLASLRRSGCSTPATGEGASGSCTPNPATNADLEAEQDNSIQALASARISQLVNDFIAAQDERINPAKPVLAVCEFERSSIYTVVVSASGGPSAYGCDPPSPSSGSTYLSPNNGDSLPSRSMKGPIPSVKSARSLFRRRSTLLSPEASPAPEFWTFKVSSCQGIPPVQIA
ncbi:hypothetical protein OC834_007771 [Tilletia horrida]|nr:hypothetical protein OC834_007771 [Tilletia horrida]